MKVLHVMIDEKFTRGVAAFYDAYYRDKGHEILYFNRHSKKGSLINNALCINQFELVSSNDVRDSLSLIVYFHKYDFIVFHSFVIPRLLKVIIYIFRKFLKKTIWIEWGYDLYSSGTDFFVNRKIKSDCKATVCIFPSDCDVYQSTFPNHSSKLFYAPYLVYPPTPPFIQGKKDRIEDKIHKNETIVVQIGHSASREINHEQAIDAISHFITTNIRIIIPLSYGDSTYAKTIKDKAISSLGNKVLVLDRFLPLEEYNQLLSSVDIAIIPSNRQIALANIYRFIQTGVKLFLSEKGVMYSFFKKNGVPVSKVESIKEMSFEEFISSPTLSADDRKKFDQFSNYFFDYKWQVQQWADFYSALEIER